MQADGAAAILWGWSARSHMEHPRMLHPQTILVVDDDADIRIIVSRLFAIHGYHVDEAADGCAAFRRARQLAPT